MKKYFKRLMSYSPYRRTLFAYVTSSVLCVLLMTALFAGIAGKSIKSRAAETSRLLLEQTARSVSGIQKSAENIILSVGSDNLALRFAAQTGASDKLTEYYLYRRFSALAAAYSAQISNISIVNFNNDAVVTYSGRKTSKTETLQFAKECGSAAYDILPRTVEMSGQKKNMVTFVRGFPYYNFSVLVDVAASQMDYPIGGENTSRSLYIIDSQGKPITENSRRAVKDMDNADYLFRYVADAGEDTLQINDKKNDNVIFFMRTQNPDWWFCDIQNQTEYNRAYRRASFVFAGLTIVLVTCCLSLSAFFGKRLQKPLAVLAAKCRELFESEDAGTNDSIHLIDTAIRRMQHEKYGTDLYMEKQYLKNLLRGRMLDYNMQSEKVREMQGRYAASYYMVMLLQFKCMEARPEGQGASGDSDTDENRENAILRYTVCNLAEEIFSSAFRCACTDEGQRSVACLLMSDSPFQSEEVIVCYENLRSFCETEVKINLAGSIGSVETGLPGIGLSYQNAKNFLELGQLVGREKLIDSSEVEKIQFRDKNIHVVSQIKEYTEEHYKDPNLSLKILSDSIGITSTYMGRVFHAVEGISYAAYLTNYRLEKSQQLLCETTRSIADIAEELGFTNSTYFATQFKKTYGVSPSVFRRNC